ncbi:hypothetical protein SK128_023133 [Halocaridina rubra]|uniref:Uncharacterized protein n=1 Tax=Halocaridina rubra TaxID=373956 RepID=A0AAN8X1N7_HALRR
MRLLQLYRHCLLNPLNEYTSDELVLNQHNKFSLIGKRRRRKKKKGAKSSPRLDRELRSPKRKEKVPTYFVAGSRECSKSLKRSFVGRPSWDLHIHARKHVWMRLR